MASSSQAKPSRRIETQIHRRKKAKARSPLSAEWESKDLTPPSHLRMPPGQMAQDVASPSKKSS